MIISIFVISLPFQGPQLSGQSFLIFAENFQASILFGFAAFLVYCCTFAIFILLGALTTAFILPNLI